MKSGKKHTITNTNNSSTKNSSNKNNQGNNKDTDFKNKTIEVAIQLGIIFLIFSWCLDIIRPFIIPVICGIIIAVAIFPLFTLLKVFMNDRNKLSAIVLTLGLLLVLITPTILITGSIIDSAQNITEAVQKGSLEIPSPDHSVNKWPLVGESLYTFWKQTTTNLESTFKTNSIEVNTIAQVILGAAASAGVTVLQFVLAILIAGVLLATANKSHRTALNISQRLAGEDNGKQYIELVVSTIRSIVQGVLGVALIQAVLASLGLYLMDIPAWGLWSVLILILAVARIPLILVFAPIIFYVFSITEITSAIIFAIWCVIISGSDGFLKPMLLGRGMSTPMLVILLGAIGGLLLSGVIGMFTGAIILALGYELFKVWLDKNLLNTEVVDES